MSDEFLPSSAQPGDDESSLPDPDENGYGYYVVEEYSGDPTLRPYDLAEGELLEPLQDLDFDPPIVETDPESDADEPANPRSGRVPFAERNWRIPLIGVLVAAVVVLASVILLLPDDGLQQKASGGLVELRRQPVKQWDEDLDGFSSSVAADDESMYLVVVKPRVTALVAFDLATGDQRWSTELGPPGAPATGSVAIVDKGLAVAFNGSSAGDGSFLLVDPANGKILWQSPVALPVAAMVSASVIGGADRGRGFRIESIDYSDKRVGEAVSADAYFLVDDVVYLDRGGVLTTADAATLQPSADFRFAHDDTIADPFRIGDDTVLGVGEQIVRLGADGAEKYSFDPQVGIIRNVMPMNGDRALVSSATRMRVVALNDDAAEEATSVRAGVSPVLTHDIEGDEFIVAFDGPDLGVGAATLRVMRVEGDDFGQVSEIALTSSDGPPPVMVVGNTAYATSFGAAPEFVAFDLNTGERLWTLPLVPDAETTVGASGVIVLTREDDESVVSYFTAGQ